MIGKKGIEKPVEVFLGIGANLNRREKSILLAFTMLKEIFISLETSSLYKSRPMYIEEQPEFLNTVFRGVTSLSASDLLKEIWRIENTIGRDRSGSVKMGPRLIDIDILLYGKEIIDMEDLKIPHSLMKEREFVLKPLVELAPEIKDPESGELFAAFLEDCGDQGVHYYCSWETLNAEFFKEIDR